MAKRKEWLKKIFKKDEPELDKSDKDYYSNGNWYYGYDEDQYLLFFKLEKRAEGRKDRWEGWEADVTIGDVKFRKTCYIKHEKIERCSRASEEERDKLNKKLLDYISKEEERLKENKERADEQKRLILS